MFWRCAGLSLILLCLAVSSGRASDSLLYGVTDTDLIQIDPENPANVAVVGPHHLPGSMIPHSLAYDPVGDVLLGLTTTADPEIRRLVQYERATGTATVLAELGGIQSGGLFEGIEYVIRQGVFVLGHGAAGTNFTPDLYVISPTGAAELLVASSPGIDLDYGVYDSFRNIYYTADADDTLVFSMFDLGNGTHAARGHVASNGAQDLAYCRIRDAFFLVNGGALYRAAAGAESIEFAAVGPIGGNAVRGLACVWRANPIVVVNGNPVVQSNAYSRGPAEISLETIFPHGTILYTLDGSDPLAAGLLYSNPIRADLSLTLRAVAFDADFSESAGGEPIEIIILPALTLTTRGGGTIVVDPPDGAYLSGDRAIVTAVPASDWNFLQWLGDAAGTNPTVQLSMTTNRSVEALFGTSISSQVIGRGSVQWEPVIDYYPHGSILRFSAIPQEDSYFVQWAGAASGVNTPLDFAVTNGHPLVRAVFALSPAGQFALTVVPLGGGQVQITPAAAYYPGGATVTLTAHPESGQRFLGWGGDAAGTANPLTVPMTGSKVIEARFSALVDTTVWGFTPEGYRFSLAGDYGLDYLIEATADFLEWRALAILPNWTGIVHFTDAQALGLPQRFYRAQPVRTISAQIFANLTWVPPGTFNMGSPSTEAGREGDEGPVTKVILTQGYWVGNHEVTQGEYVEVTGVNLSSFTGQLNRPVEQVSWVEAVAYCQALTDRERQAGRLPSGFVYRLPTEADWEYACRAGVTTRFSYGDDPDYTKLTQFGWYFDNSGNSTHSVGGKRANAWGLFDVHGNLSEWCLDWYGNRLPGGTVTDPQGPASGTLHVYRGGHWGSQASQCRSAHRLSPWLGDRSNRIGFRVVLARPQ